MRSYQRWFPDQGSSLKQTSIRYPTRLMPVRRGNLLCTVEVAALEGALYNIALGYHVCETQMNFQKVLGIDTT